MALSKQQLKQYRQLLITEREKFAEEIRVLAHEALRSPREASGDLSGYTVHMADMASDTYERELSTKLVSSEQEVLYQIDDALKRIDEDAFGVCGECNKAIPLSRLKAVPYAPLCIQCQQAKEQSKKG